MKDSRMSYRYYFSNRDGVDWVEFHTGWDTEEVRAGMSLNKAISMDVAGVKLSKWFRACEYDIDTHELQRA